MRTLGYFDYLRVFKMFSNANSKTTPNKINQGKMIHYTHFPVLKPCFLTQILSTRSWPARFPPPAPATQALQSSWISLPAAGQELPNFCPTGWSSGPAVPWQSRTSCFLLSVLSKPRQLLFNTALKQRLLKTPIRGSWNTSTNTHTKTVKPDTTLLRKPEPWSWACVQDLTASGLKHIQSLW